MRGPMSRWSSFFFLFAGCASATPTATNNGAPAEATLEPIDAAAPVQDAAVTASSVLQTAAPGRVGIEEVAVGDGATAREGDRLSVHYTGTLTDGTEFDSSRKRAPIEFRLGERRVIRGWELGIEGMRVGGRRKLTIPPDLGYGERGAGGVIPPNATLLFDVELVDVR